MRMPVMAVMAGTLVLAAVAKSQPTQRPGEATAPLPPAVSGAGAAPRASPLPHAPVKPGTGSSAAPSPAESGGEEDIGLEGYAPVGCSPVYSERTGNVGPTTGDPEKDSYGATVTGLTCP